jgi:hypothetical protein
LRDEFRLKSSTAVEVNARLYMAADGTRADVWGASNDYPPHIEKNKGLLVVDAITTLQAMMKSKICVYTYYLGEARLR